MNSVSHKASHGKPLASTSHDVADSASRKPFVFWSSRSQAMA